MTKQKTTIAERELEKSQSFIDGLFIGVMGLVVLAGFIYFMSGVWQQWDDIHRAAVKINAS